MTIEMVELVGEFRLIPSMPIADTVAMSKENIAHTDPVKIPAVTETNFVCDDPLLISADIEVIENHTVASVADC